jgi:hypothetical protein
MKGTGCGSFGFDVALLCEKGDGALNLDRAGWTSSEHTVAAWVIDGATPLPEKNREVRYEKCSEFVDAISGVLFSVSLAPATPSYIFNAAHKVAYSSTDDSAEGDFLWQLPLAAIAWARTTLRDSWYELDYVCFGDCLILLETPSGEPRILRNPSSGMEEVIQRRLARIRELDGAERVHEEDALAQLMKRRREEQHSEPRTMAFSLCSDTIAYVASGRIVSSVPMCFHLLTDGFYRISDSFGLSVGDLASELRSSPRDVYTRLRMAERAASYSTVLKRSDDASAVSVKTWNEEQ